MTSRRSTPIFCSAFYGTDEEDDICPTLQGTGIEVIGINGGHHFDEDYPALVKRIMDGYDKRMAANTASGK